MAQNGAAAHGGEEPVDQPPEQQPQPSSERPAAGDLGQLVGAAVVELSSRADRGRNGCFLPGNTAAGKSLSRSEQLWSALAPAKRLLVEQVAVDLAADDSAAATLRGTVEAYAEVRLLRASLFARLSESGGPVTPKGAARALFAAYLSALDRELRIATTLGMERKAKPVSPLDALRAAVDAARPVDTTPPPSVSTDAPAAP